MTTQHDPKGRALAAHLGVEPETISEAPYCDGAYECDDEPGEWLVLTDSEADAAANEALESYIDDCLTDGWPETAVQYFDRDSWKRDALLSDGRGHVVSSYDGAENEEQIDGVWYFIYRMN